MCNLGSILESTVLAWADRKTGFRWCFTGQPGFTGSLLMPLTGTSDTWLKGVAHADYEPHALNSSGLHIFHTQQTAMNQSPGSYCFALLKVEYWGKIVQHDFGVRAQHARILQITTIHQTPRLSLRYMGIPHNKVLKFSETVNYG